MKEGRRAEDVVRLLSSCMGALVNPRTLLRRRCHHQSHTTAGAVSHPCSAPSPTHCRCGWGR